MNKDNIKIKNKLVWSLVFVVSFILISVSQVIAQPQGEVEGLLIDAVLDNRLDKVKKILSDTDINFYYRPTALYKAVENGNESIVKLLLENKTSNPKDEAAVLLKAVENNRKNIVKLLLEYGNIEVPAQNDSLLKSAINNNEDMVKILLENGNINTSGINNILNLLSHLRFNNHDDVFKILISAKTSN